MIAGAIVVLSGSILWGLGTITSTPTNNAPTDAGSFAIVVGVALCIAGCAIVAWVLGIRATRSSQCPVIPWLTRLQKNAIYLESPRRTPRR